MKKYKDMKNYKDIDPFDEENWEEDKKEILINKLNNYGFYNSRLISGSKSYYRKNHPLNLIVFNANIFTEEFGKIWYGDLDLTIDSKNLIKIYDELGINLYILSEMSGRFDNENRNDFKKDSIWDTKNGLSPEMQKYFDKKTLKYEKIL